MNVPGMPELPPWSRQADWQEACRALDYLILKFGHRLDGAKSSAQKIQQSIGHLSPHIDHLCSLTCPDCSSRCCTKATVWYDFRDLLYLRLTSQDDVRGQILKKQDGSCCNLGPHGCLIPRRKRPFICTWYLCPPQKIILSEAIGAADRAVEAVLEEIKHLRIDLEAEFISVQR